MNELEQLKQRLAALERQLSSRSVQTPTYWARVKHDATGNTNPLIGTPVVVEPMINDRSQAASHKIGLWSGGERTVQHRYNTDLTEDDLVLCTVTSQGHAILAGGGAGGGGHGVIGEITDDGCDTGVPKMRVTHKSECVDLPGEYLGEITLTDFWGVLSKIPEARRIGATVGASYYRPVDNCDDGIWVPEIALSGDNCADSGV